MSAPLHSARKDDVEACKRQSGAALTGIPLVTVCVSTYNHAAFLAQALDSVLMQRADFPFEVILHDDCSTDGTKDIVRAYAKEHPLLIRPILQETNQYSQGRKILPITFGRARGKYIALLEGDDYWTDPLKLQKQVDFLEASPDYALVFHNLLMQSGSEDPNGKYYTLPRMERLYRKFRMQLTTTIRDLATGNFVQMPSPLFRASAIQNGVKNFDTFHGDWPLFLQIAMTGDLYFMDEVMAVHRYHDGGIWTRLSSEEKNMTLLDASLRFYFSNVFDNDVNMIICDNIVWYSRRLKGSAISLDGELRTNLSQLQKVFDRMAELELQNEDLKIKAGVCQNSTILRVASKFGRLKYRLGLDKRTSSR